MTECPKCHAEITGSGCACGYRVPPKPEEYAHKPFTRGENYRQRWFRENKQEYFPPKLDNCIFFARLGGSMKVPRKREPGDDDEVAA